MLSIEFEVRDYECDVQGIVNNSVYLNYFEHARHQYFKKIDLDFLQLTRAGLNLVLYRAEMDYRCSLRPGDKFRIDSSLERLSKTRCVFHQQLFKDDKLYNEGKFFVTCLNERGRPVDLDCILNRGHEGRP